MLTSYNFGFVRNSKLSDIINTILYLEPINVSRKSRCKQVKERKVLSLHARSVHCVICPENYICEAKEKWNP